MEYISLIVDAFQILLFVYLGSTSLFLFILAFASLFPLRKKKITDPPLKRFAVLIPSYKEDAVILEVAEDACKQNYPRELHDIIIIADSLKPETIETMRKLPLTVIEVSFEKSTKSKALNAAFAQLPSDKYDYALILDADNIMESDFLRKLNEGFARGYFAIQGHRIAKNTNTHLAVLDAVSEEINNSIFRKGNCVLGLSSSLIGSGMAFEYEPFKKIMSNIKAIGGFDKELELYMTRNRLIVDYLPDAYVKDEKVQNFDNFSNQRRRWLSAQFIYWRATYPSAIKELFTNGNIDFFLRSNMQMQLPRILLLGFSFLIFITSLLFDNGIFPILWSIHFGMVVLALFLAIPHKYYSLQTLKAVFFLPKGFFFMLKSLLSIKGANTTFIHTEHGTTEKEEK